MIKSSKKKIKTKNTARLNGDILLSQPKIFNHYITAIWVIMIIGLVFLILGSYDKKARVTGIITTNKGLTKIIAKEPGIIKKQLFRGGDTIKETDILYNISKTRSSTEKGDIDADILAELSRAKSLQLEKLKDHQKLTNITSGYFANKILEKESELNHLLKEAGLLEKQLEISNDNLTRFEKLRLTGNVGDIQYNERKASLIGIEINKEQIMFRIAATRSDIVDLKNQLLVHPITSKIEENEIRQSLNQFEQQIIEVSARRDYNIASPTNGLIATDLTKEGEAVKAGQTLMTILPSDSLLHAELYVPSDSIGFVKEGQHVSMRYSAFPFEHYGLYDGTVSEVSKVISQPGELAEATGLAQAVYKVTVTLDSQKVNIDGKQQPLQVGMELNATITLESRSILQWMLAPIYSLRGRV